MWDTISMANQVVIITTVIKAIELVATYACSKLLNVARRWSVIRGRGTNAENTAVGMFLDAKRDKFLIPIVALILILPYVQVPLIASLSYYNKALTGYEGLTITLDGINDLEGLKYNSIEPVEGPEFVLVPEATHVAPVIRAVKEVYAGTGPFVEYSSTTKKWASTRGKHLRTSAGKTVYGVIYVGEPVATLNNEVTYKCVRPRRYTQLKYEYRLNEWADSFMYNERREMFTDLGVYCETDDSAPNVAGKAYTITRIDALGTARDSYSGVALKETWLVLNTTSRVLTTLYGEWEIEYDEDYSDDGSTEAFVVNKLTETLDNEATYCNKPNPDYIYAGVVQNVTYEGTEECYVEVDIRCSAKNKTKPLSACWVPDDGYFNIYYTNSDRTPEFPSETAKHLRFGADQYLRTAVGNIFASKMLNVGTEEGDFTEYKNSVKPSGVTWTLVAAIVISVSLCSLYKIPSSGVAIPVPASLLEAHELGMREGLDEGNCASPIEVPDGAVFGITQNMEASFDHYGVTTQPQKYRKVLRGVELVHSPPGVASDMGWVS